VQNPAGFFRRRAGACLRLRRKHRFKSEDWLQYVNLSRRFIASRRAAVKGSNVSRKGQVAGRGTIPGL